MTCWLILFVLMLGVLMGAFLCMFVHGMYHIIGL